MKYKNIFLELSDNMLEILTDISRGGPLTINELMDITGMPRTTVNRNIKKLMELTLIQQDISDISTGGRPPSIYLINPNGFFVFGIELSRSNVMCVLCNGVREPIWNYDIALHRDTTPDIVFQEIFERLIMKMEELKIDKERLIGIGIGSVGPLDMSKGILLNPKGFLNHNWRDLDLKEIFEEKFNTPTFVANGASMAVMGEFASNVSKGINNIIYMNNGVGIRVGVVSNGLLVGGDIDREGAYGHLIVEPGGKPCYCRKYGCIESYSTIPAIVKSFREEARKGRRSILLEKKKIKEINFDDISEACESGDILAMDIMDRAATYMGITLGNIINSVHPQMAVIGGVIPESSTFYYKRLVQMAKDNIYSPGNMNCIFRPSSLGVNTMATGAAAFVLSRYFNKKVV